MARPTQTEKTRLNTIRSDEDVKCWWSGPYVCFFMIAAFNEPRAKLVWAAPNFKVNPLARGQGLTFLQDAIHRVDHDQAHTMQDQGRVLGRRDRGHLGELCWRRGVRLVGEGGAAELEGEIGLERHAGGARFQSRS